MTPALRILWTLLFALVHELLVYGLFILPGSILWELQMLRNLMTWSWDTTLFLPGLYAVLAGFLIVPLAILTARPRASIDGSREVLTATGIFWPWGNLEEGYDAPFSYELWPHAGDFERRWLWAAWRNPANNLRFIRWMYAPPVVGQVHVLALSDGWLLLWQGWRHRLISPDYRLTIGFKYEPADVVTPCTDWRHFGCGFGVRLIPN